MVIFGAKPWANPFGKMSISRRFELVVFIAQKGVFWFQNIAKNIFLAYIAIKKGWKNGHFGEKPWVNPFGKVSIFRLFQLLVFIAQKGVFSFLNIVNDILLGILPKKKVEILPFLDQNHELTPFEKCKFFEFVNFLFLFRRRGVLSFQNVVNDTFLA